MLISLIERQALLQHAQELATKFHYLGITASDLEVMGFDELIGRYKFLSNHAENGG